MKEKNNQTAAPYQSGALHRTPQAIKSGFDYQDRLFYARQKLLICSKFCFILAFSGWLILWYQNASNDSQIKDYCSKLDSLQLPNKAPRFINESGEVQWIFQPNKPAGQRWIKANP